MKNTVRLLLAAGAIAVSSSSCRRGPLDVHDVLARHTEARGGAEALESVRSLTLRLHLSEPDFEADLLYRAMRPAMARVDVIIDGQTVFTEAYDGRTSWQRGGGGSQATPGSPEGTAALRRGAIGNLYALHELPDLGHRVALFERTEIDGVSYYTLEVTFDDGHVRYCYVDPESFFVTRRRDVHALHPDVDSTERWIESRSTDFREVEGIVRSFQSVDRDLRTGEQLQTVEVLDVTLNPDLDSDIFAMPGANTETIGLDPGS